MIAKPHTASAIHHHGKEGESLNMRWMLAYGLLTNAVL